MKCKSFGTADAKVPSRHGNENPVLTRRQLGKDAMIRNMVVRCRFEAKLLVLSLVI
jgi:hypothetical protein